MAAYEVLLLNTAIPQIQAAQTGDTYVVPRDIAVNASLNVTGDTTLGDASTDTVQVNGYMGVGGAGNSSQGIRIASTSLTGIVQYGVFSAPVFNSAATTLAIGLAGRVDTQDAAFTVAEATALYAFNPVKGAASTITNSSGLIVKDQTVGVNNFGIKSEVTSGTNKWNIYASGTADNYFAGDVGIGTSAPLALMHASAPLSAGTIVNVGMFSQLSGSNPTVGQGARITLAANSSVNRCAAIEGVHESGTNAHYLAFLTSANGTNPAERGRFSSIGGFITMPAAGGHAVFNEDGVDADFRVESDTNTHALFVEATNSNVKIGGSAERATTVGTNHLDIFNGTAPVGTLANGISLYSSSGEAYVMDAAGNATLFSPHDAETNEWIFKSKHTPTGKVLKIDVERLLRFVNDHFGLDAVQEFTEE